MNLPCIKDLQLLRRERSVLLCQLKEAESVVLDGPLHDLDLGLGRLLQDLEPSQLDIRLELETPPLWILIQLGQQVVALQIAPEIGILDQRRCGMAWIFMDSGTEIEILTFSRKSAPF